MSGTLLPSATKASPSVDYYVKNGASAEFTDLIVVDGLAVGGTLDVSGLLTATDGLIVEGGSLVAQGPGGLEAIEATITGVILNNDPTSNIVANNIRSNAASATGILVQNVATTLLTLTDDQCDGIYFLNVGYEDPQGAGVVDVASCIVSVAYRQGSINVAATITPLATPAGTTFTVVGNKNTTVLIQITQTSDAGGIPYGFTYTRVCKSSFYAP